ncbi:unnamed protein product [Urochloa humidicola]
MPFSSMPLAVLSCLALLAASAAAHRPAPFAFAPALAAAALPVAAGSRLEGEGSSEQQWQCWEAAAEVRSCTGEIILYLLNGEAYLPGARVLPRHPRRRAQLLGRRRHAVRHRLHPRGRGHAQGLLRRGRRRQWWRGRPRRATVVAKRESVVAAAVAGRKSGSAHR